MEFQFDFENNGGGDFIKYVEAFETYQDLELRVYRSFEFVKTASTEEEIIILRKASRINENPLEQQKLNSDIYKKFIILATRVRAVLEMISKIR